ncbi:MAG: hypothetical protein MK168_06415 [Candidatus Thalassarchaeum sp.]|nr:hypothetical protein [Candidatus Thalassarchaeum sp.]
MGKWALNRCECGHSFGTMGNSSMSCSRCGSSKSRIVKNFDDAQSLSDAVSMSNMPKEIAEDIGEKLSSYNRRPQKATSSHSNASKLIRAMRDATGDDGQLTLKSLSVVLDRMEISETSAEKLIGQAEFEGKLLREGPDSWSWLQQSS